MCVQAVFPFLSARKIPFVFTSSYLQSQPTSYGAVKRMGEMWMRALNHQGKIVRLWNVYGRERIGLFVFFPPRSAIYIYRYCMHLSPDLTLMHTRARARTQPPRLGPKSHVMGDWVSQCLPRPAGSSPASQAGGGGGGGAPQFARGMIRALSDGYEARQFIHAADTVHALGLIMVRVSSLCFPLYVPCDAYAKLA